jgi:hypothetical protein
VSSSSVSNAKVVKGCKVTLGAVGAANNSGRTSPEPAARKAGGSVEAPPAAKPGQCRQQ